MAQKAIIHTASRVIRRLTTKTSPILASDETAIDMVPDIDISVSGATTYWKLDGSDNKIPATAQDIDDAGVDPDIEAVKSTAAKTEYANALDQAITEATAGSGLLRFLQAIKDMN